MHYYILNQLHHRPGRYGLAALLLALLLTACGGGSGGGGSANNSETVELHIRVLSHQGARLGGAEVSIGDASGTTESDGALSLEVSAADEVVATARLEGFITQSLLLPADTDGLGQIRLMPVKDTFALENIEAPRTLATRELGGRLTVPADAFVTTSGELASGPATLAITPWDISSDDLNAMPGNSQALDTTAERVALISAGMMTVQAHSNTGEPLQLAPGVEATLQLDLPIDSINGQALDIGDTIPMWHFDESQGLWIEDETVLGIVVASATSPVGLAVSAKVPHFSTWNWDFKFEGGGSVNVNCVLAIDQTPAPCTLSAFAILPDGSVITSISGIGNFVAESGVTMINMPANATLELQASDENGRLGFTTSSLVGGSSLNVTINLHDPTTVHNVQCLISNNSSVPCNVSMTDGTSSLSLDNGTQLTNVVTHWPGVLPTTNITWQAESLLLLNGKTYIGSGSTVTTGGEGQVPISLSLEEVDAVDVNCVTSTNTPLPCLVTADASVPGGSTISVMQSLSAEGGSLLLPYSASYIEWQADSTEAIAQQGEFITFSGTATTNLMPTVTLVLDVENVQSQSAQELEVRCIMGDFASSDYCDITVYRGGGSSETEKIEEWVGVAKGLYQTLTLPDGITESEILIFEAKGDDGEAGTVFEMYNGLIDGQQIDIELSFGVS